MILGQPVAIDLQQSACLFTRVMNVGTVPAVQGRHQSVALSNVLHSNEDQDSSVTYFCFKVPLQAGVIRSAANIIVEPTIAPKIAPPNALQATSSIASNNPGIPSNPIVVSTAPNDIPMIDP